MKWCPKIFEFTKRTSWVADETVLYPPLQKKKEFAVKSTGSYLHLDYLTLHDNLLALGVGRYPNILEAVDVTSGDTLWTFEVPESMGSMSFACAQNDSMIFAGGQSGLGLYALEKSTGKVRWSKPIGSLFTRNLLLDDTRAYTIGDSLYCLSITDGATIWSHHISIQATPAVDGSFVYVVGNYKIQIFDKLSGELLWWKTNSQRCLSGITLDDDCFYMFSNDTVFAYFKESKNVKWLYHSPGDTLLFGGQNTFAISNNKLCLTIEGNGHGQAELVVLNKENGEFLWDHAFPGNWVFAPTIANGMVYIVSLQGELYGFDLNDGTQKLYDHSFYYENQPIIANNELYVAAISRVIVWGNSETRVDYSNQSPPRDIELMPNYPNPFNAQTEISYILHNPGVVSLRVFDGAGREVRTLVQDVQNAGSHRIFFDASGLPSGVYLCRLQCGSAYRVQKMLVLR